jgi:hypothetical protein
VAKERQSSQEASAGDHAIILQAGRDAILQMEKSPPKIRLVRVSIDDDRTEGGLKQKINIIMKNTGDTTAFLQRGRLLTEAKEKIVACMKQGMQFRISVADWTYEVDIDDSEAEFVGRHSIAPNEVVNFDISAGRKTGGFELTIYRCKLKFEFDEGEPLITKHFFLRISGPTEFNAGYQAYGPTPDQWGRCEADNIRRLDAIGFNYRDLIDPKSHQYIEAVAPGIFHKTPSIS